MRDYGKVSPQFWIGETGKLLRGNLEAQVLALYLMTNPHATMTGVFHCPIIYMAHETGLSMEGASKGLARLIEVGFCEYDEPSESVFVVNMAAYQIDDSLKPDDKRVLGLRKEVSKMLPARFQHRFVEVYGLRFHLEKQGENNSPLQAPCKPLPSQEQEQEQEQEQDKTSSSSGKPDDQLPCPVEKLIEAYHEAMPSNPACKVLNDARKRSIRQRWREASRMQCRPFGYTTQADGVDAWRQFFGVCAESDFLTGRVPGRNGSPPFVADVDFLFSPSGFAKVLENKYHREAV